MGDRRRFVETGEGLIVERGGGEDPDRIPDEPEDPDDG